MDKKEFYIVRLLSLASKELLELKELAFYKFRCGGCTDFTLNEEQVDEILQERAYSGGDIPQEIIDEVEEKASSVTDGQIEFYFYADSCKEDAESFLAHLREIGMAQATVEVAPWSDWNESWKESYRPILISDKLEVVPEWDKGKHIGAVEHQVYIYPGMGFGTGGHETTYLCLKLLTTLDHESFSTCLDFGCGSGILGIAAMKLHANIKVDFCDIDKAALDNCLQNLQLNFDVESLDGHRLVSRERFKVEKKFSLVFANILEHILREEDEVIVNSLDLEGYLILSGLLQHQIENIQDHFVKMGLSLIGVDRKGDWGAILLKKEK
jgi:ribosomal protein L11 methyltransferase